MGEYNLYFKNQELELTEAHKDYPENWNLKIDLSVLSQTIEFLQSENVNIKKAKEIANLKGNQEMLKHRKNLGYLPEPITDTEDLTELLMWASSNKPEDKIWKWLNPLNIFELADVCNKLDEFEKLHNTIDNYRAEIIYNILSEISKYIKNDLKFTETFSLTIGFAIRGWATDNRFGVNIENIKDDYNRLIATIAHELFHRLQTRICKSEGQEQIFSGITSGSFRDEKDNKFYEVLSYIMLEGTGEFITHQFTAQKQDNLQKKVDEGLDLLNETYKTIYDKGELEKVDELLNKGLKSNGVFYSLGEYITKLLVKSKGESYLGEILEKGVGSFFVEGLKNIENHEIDKLLNKILTF